jgi:hypothetical protein
MRFGERNTAATEGGVPQRDSAVGVDVAFNSAC